jgi:dTDP-4-amino-4,6-dideoxygalactose transaminase
MPTTISLSPNIQPDDLFVVFKTLLSPWCWSDKRINRKIARLISAHLANRPTALVSSGRSAIYRTLEALDIGPGDEVIVQAFTCLAVPAPILWRKAKPIYADIDLATYNFNLTDVAKKISPRTKAIIVQHTFGLAGPVKELRQLADRHNLTLIEDLSHSFGASLHDQALGTFGHVAILSFGRDKTVSCVFGGAVTSVDAALIQRVEQKQAQLPNPPAWWVVQQLLHPLLMAIIIPLYFVGSIGKVLLVVAQKMKLLSMAVTKAEKQGHQPPFIDWQFSSALGFLLLNQLRKLNQFTLRRQTVARRYFHRLPIGKQITPPNIPNWLRVPVRVKNRSSLLSRAKKQHILLGNWYDHPITPVTNKSVNFTGYINGSCPQAELAAARTINLPTHPNLTDEQIDQIVSVMSQARWARI